MQKRLLEIGKMEKWGFGSSVFLVDKAGFDYQNAGVGIPKGHLANFGRRCFNSKCEQNKLWAELSFQKAPYQW